VHFLLALHTSGWLCMFCSVYMERLHRPGNKLILVHSIQLPELSISKARMSTSVAVIISLWLFCHLNGGVLTFLSVWGEVQICIWPSGCHCHSLSFAAV